MFGNSERRTQHWEKAVDPPGEATEDAWQVMEVAKRMGMGHLFPWPDDDWHEPMFEEYRRFGLGHREGPGLLPAAPGDPRYALARGGWQGNPVPLRRRVRSLRPEGRGRALLQGEGIRREGRVLAPPYHPAAESPDDEYPFWLCTGRILEHWHTGSMTRRVKQLHQAAPENYVEINRADATELSINSGDLVRVVSRRGELELKAKVDGRGKPPRGSVFIPFFDEPTGQPPDGGCHVQHQQGTGLQEMRGPGGEGLMRRRGFVSGSA